jgi:hypothetical protein
MRTTVTLPDETLSRVRQIAAARHESVSSILTRFTLLGLERQGHTLELKTDSATGLPVISVRRPITAREVAEAIGE